MSYRTVLVHVDSAEAGARRLSAAVSVAKNFNATLFGIGAQAFDVWPDPTGLSHKVLRENISQNLEKAEAYFRAKTASLGDNIRWHSEIEFPTKALAQKSFACDLVVTSLSAGNPSHQIVADPGDLIFSAGVPVLVVPSEIDTVDARHIVIAWKNTRETRRAIWDALPFLIKAERVHIVRILAARDESGTSDELSLLVERLRRHGVKAESETRQRSASSVAQDLMDVADSVSSEMIVMGGYGYPRLQEWVLGGVTQDYLSIGRKCALFSH